MPSLNMQGPYQLSPTEIDRVVPKENIGNYALGYTRGDEVFIVRYVGRSDSCVNSRLKHWEGKYAQFKWSSAQSVRAAFEKECKNFHDFGGLEALDNERHPDSPNGTTLKCPFC